MQTTRDIYERFRVPPWLQLHQLRVAAVAAMTAKAQRSSVDMDLIVRTGLLHDIGAIVKFDFSFNTHSDLQALCPPDDVLHWSAVQAEVRKRYGSREHEASRAMLKEIGLADVQEVFDAMGIQNIPRVLAGGFAEAQIAQYGDMRVGPHGVLSIADRVADVSKRYAAYWEREGRSNESKHYLRFSRQLESHLFQNAAIAPADITDEALQPLIDAFWEYEIA